METDIRDQTTVWSEYLTRFHLSDLSKIEEGLSSEIQIDCSNLHQLGADGLILLDDVQLSPFEASLTAHHAIITYNLVKNPPENLKVSFIKIPSKGSELEILDLQDTIANYLKIKHKEDLDNLSRHTSKVLEIDYTGIDAFGRGGHEFADMILYRPDHAINEVIAAITGQRLIKYHLGEDLPKYAVRFNNIPQEKKKLIRDIRNDDVGKLISIEGIVKRTAQTKPRMVMATFRCKHGHPTVKAQGFGDLKKPFECSQDGCNNKSLELMPDAPSTSYCDSQYAVVQEVPEGMGRGQQPRDLPVDLIDDLTEIVTPGERVVMNCIVRRVPKENSTLCDLYLECNSLKRSEQDYEELSFTEEEIFKFHEMAEDPDLFEKLVQSLAPHIFGNSDVKEGVILQLFGGVPKKQKDGTRSRGDIHVLIISDPGIGKSQIFKFVQLMVPRAIYTTGGTSSKAGLTAAAVRDEMTGAWTLEAGALVLADGSIVILDELDKLPKAERGSLNEAMEQQEVSIAKAGITARLKARTGVLAAANPKLGRFDNVIPLADQLDIDPTILSRFDLIFTIYDTPENEKDSKIAEHMLQSHLIGESLAAGIEFGDEINYVPIEAPIEIDLFRKYLAYSKRYTIPKMRPEAMAKLKAYYLDLRSLATPGKPVPVTARSLDGIVRLAEAWAKVFLSPWVEEWHADKAISTMDRCLRHIAYDPKTGIFDIDRATGKTDKKKRDIQYRVKAIIGDLTSDENRGRVQEIVVREQLMHEGYEEEDIDRTISSMLRSGGDLMSPKNGFIKLI